MEYIKKVESELAPLREELKNHHLYRQLNSIEDIEQFMKGHVFAVWDFMSLLKSLQANLTCINVPWTPVSSAKTARFINEIVFGEETDIDSNDNPISHFEMYLDAMQELGASTNEIDCFIHEVNNGVKVQDAISTKDLPLEVKEFVNHTFEVIESGKTHQIASAFTFGREDLIPEMFLEIVKNTINGPQSYQRLTYYLERHIELDGDEHGPLALEMITELCGNDAEKWDEVIATAKHSIKQRINLWNGIAKELVTA